MTEAKIEACQKCGGKQYRLRTSGAIATVVSTEVNNDLVDRKCHIGKIGSVILRLVTEVPVKGVVSPVPVAKTSNDDYNRLCYPVGAGSLWHPDVLQIYRCDGYGSSDSTITCFRVLSGLKQVMTDVKLQQEHHVLSGQLKIGVICPKCDPLWGQLNLVFPLTADLATTMLETFHKCESDRLAKLKEEAAQVQQLTGAINGKRNPEFFKGGAGNGNAI